MNTAYDVDVMIVGAGPVGLMCAYLGALCGIKTCIVDKTQTPLKVGRADALNARTLQLLEWIGLFDELYPLGKTCCTSSVWADGKFISRQSSWWDELEGCFHKHFLMIGQSHLEHMLNKHLKQYESSVERLTYVKDIKVIEDGCLTTLSTGKKIKSSYVIGADGSSSFVRNHFKIAFDVVYPQIIWAVIDGIIDTNFPKVPEIIVFQVETSDVAWIPRERNLDRFYVRMDRKDFALEEVIKKINKAIKPYHLNFREIVWFSQFSVKESVAENFFVYNRIFLAGDSAHIHSVNGGQGLNTGLADAFNLMWKINLVINFHVSKKILKTYEQERKPIALSVINSSGELVRSTKYSPMGTHAEDYVRIVQKYAGNITGMGIRYGTTGIVGTRLFDLELYNGSTICRLYSLLNYQTFHLLVFGLYDKDILILPAYVKVLHIPLKKQERGFWTKDLRYAGQAILVRSDAYIEAFGLIEEVEILIKNLVEKMA